MCLIGAGSGFSAQRMKITNPMANKIRFNILRRLAIKAASTTTDEWALLNQLLQQFIMVSIYACCIWPIWYRYHLWPHFCLSTLEFWTCWMNYFTSWFIVTSLFSKTSAVEFWKKNRNMQQRKDRKWQHFFWITFDCWSCHNHRWQWALFGDWYTTIL